MGENSHAQNFIFNTNHTAKEKQVRSKFRIFESLMIFFIQFIQMIIGTQNVFVQNAVTSMHAFFDKHQNFSIQ